jgi:hypothetical protein
VSYYCYGKTQEFIMVVFVIGPWDPDDKERWDSWQGK